MLTGEDDCGDPLGNAKLILHRHLRLAVWPQVIDLARGSYIGEQGGQAVGQHHREGQELLRFAAGVAIHNALVAGSSLVAACYGSCNIRALGVDENFYIEVSAIVSGPAHRVADNGGDIRHSQSSDFSGDDNFARGRQNFAGNAGVGIVFQTAVQPGICYGIAQFVRVSRCDRLR